jgi:hypothetical protein
MLSGGWQDNYFFFEKRKYRERRKRSAITSWQARQTGQYTLTTNISKIVILRQKSIPKVAIAKSSFTFLSMEEMNIKTYPVKPMMATGIPKTVASVPPLETAPQFNFPLISQTVLGMGE